MIALLNDIVCNKWPIAVHRPQLHLTISEAIRRARNSDLYTGSLKRSAIKSWLYRLAQASAGSGSRIQPVIYQDRLYVPASLHPALNQIGSAARSSVSVQSLPASRRNRAAAKVQAIRDFERFTHSAEAQSVGIVAARALFVDRRRDRYHYLDGDKTATLRMSVRSLERWFNLEHQGGVDALARDGRGGARAEGPNPEAVKLYWSIRNDPRRFSIRACWLKVTMAAKHKGWEWFDKFPTCSAWDRKSRNVRGLILNQRGNQEYTRQCGAYVELDSESYDPGQCWVGDDSTLDLWVKMPNGEIVRPVISCWLDWRSRAVVGYSIIRTGNEHSLLLGFRDGAREYGLPQQVIVDNGKNYGSYIWQGGRPKRRNYKRDASTVGHFEGLFRLCEVEPSWCLPYNPNGKARLERWFRTLEDQCIRNFPSYCGRTPNDRPEAHKRLVAKAVEWDTFVSAVKKYISIYNATPHSGDGMDGLTPLQVLSQRTHKKPLPDGLDDFLLLAWHRPVQVGRNGVAIRIAGATVRYGAFEPALTALSIGTEVRVSYDPENLDSIVIWSMEHRFICRAEQNIRHNRSINTEQLRDTMRKRSRAKRILRQSRNIGVAHIIHDPVEHAIASLAADAERRRKPDPKPPAGGPLLIPLQTPVKVPSKKLRKAVGAECVDEADDISDLISDFLARDMEVSCRDSVPSGAEALARFVEANE